ncbi:MAG: relaxase/mobilization nuclease domain-containing protein [Pseudomonadota bacterium]
MIPKIHAKGSSFKGAAKYLLHDKGRAQTAERVAWTESRNLAVEDPDMGWRIMAATAMDQDRLKAEAGVKNTGRRSNKHVLHISLAWHPDQEPTREEMSAAADQALKAIGADDRQAMIIAHDDEKHPHLHLLVNRVSPENGKHLSSSHDRLKLSKWAEKYERECGHIYCEDRVVNNAMREQGEYVKGERDQPRHIFEAQGPAPAPANDNDRDQAMRAEQRAKDHALAQRGRNLAVMQARAWAELEDAHKQRKAAVARQHERNIAAAKASAREQYRPAWRELYRTQDSERQTFEALEESFFGRASNMAKTIKLSSQDIGGDTTGIIGRTFGILTNAGKRKEYFEAAQERQKQALQRQQDAMASEATKSHEATQAANLANLRAVFADEREHVLRAQEAERASLQEDWKVRNAERKAAFQAQEGKAAQREALKEAHRKAAAPQPEPKAQTDNADTKASTPPTQSRQDRIKEFLERSRVQEQNNAPDRELDRDDDIDI